MALYRCIERCYVCYDVASPYTSTCFFLCIVLYCIRMKQLPISIDATLWCYGFKSLYRRLQKSGKIVWSSHTYNMFTIEYHQSKRQHSNKQQHRFNQFASRFVCMHFILSAYKPNNIQFDTSPQMNLQQIGCVSLKFLQLKISKGIFERDFLNKRILNFFYRFIINLKSQHRKSIIMADIDDNHNPKPMVSKNEKQT